LNVQEILLTATSPPKTRDPDPPLYSPQPNASPGKRKSPSQEETFESKVPPKYPLTPAERQKLDPQLKIPGQFAVGDFVWAKLKTFPWWPAKVRKK
jgi:hypothetical protein